MQRRQKTIYQHPQFAQRMRGRNPLLQGSVAEHLRLGYVGTAHEIAISLNSKDKLYHLHGICRVFQQPAMDLKNFCFVETVFDQPLVKVLEAEDLTRSNYAQWLGAEAVRVNYPLEDGTLKTVAISREMIIKRVANTLDGSHPSIAGSVANDAENAFDAAVHHLLGYQMGGLPLPYFILLKAAQDILANAPKLLNLETPEG